MPNDSKLTSVSGARWLLLSIAVIALDQITKAWAVKTLIFQEPKVILSFFNWYLDFNKGAAFSMLNSNPTVAMWLFGGIAIAVSVILIVWLLFIPTQNQLQSMALSLILGGALGNFTDRVRLGHVVDFIQLHLKELYWPVFNVADIAITIGAGLLIITMLLRK